MKPKPSGCYCTHLLTCRVCFDNCIPTPGVIPLWPVFVPALNRLVLIPGDTARAAEYVVKARSLSGSFDSVYLYGTRDADSVIVFAD